MEEEEIITPEEEIFDYNKLRYILTNDGYICHASIGGFIVCDLGECTEYNGDIPDGYETIEEWYEEENERLNAWKIVDGNLEFDPNKYEILQAKCEKEHEDNRYVCHKEISNLTNLVKSDNADSYLKSTSILSNFIEVTDSNKFASTYIELRTNENISNKLHIKFNNGNLLTNSATSKMDSGISFEVNADRTIKIKGTATNDIEFNIGGTPTNIKPILAFKKGINYYLSSNDYQIKMYSFDGTDREEIYSGTGGVINFTDKDKLVTQIVLFIPSGTKVNEIIKPMLNVGDTAKEYITYEGNDAIVYLGENTFYKGDNIKINEGTPILQNEVYISDDLIIGDDFIIGGDFKELDDIGMPITYLDLTYMYCMEDVDLQVTYPNTKKNNDLTGYETPNGGFAIDEEGNMYCNNGTFTGGQITIGSEKYDSNNPNSKIMMYSSENKDDNLTIYPNSINIDDDTGAYANLQVIDYSGISTSGRQGSITLVSSLHSSCMLDPHGLQILSYDDRPQIYLARYGTNKYCVINAGSSSDEPYFKTANAASFSSMSPNGVWSPSFNNNSLAKQKKNFKLLENALEIIKNTDIYKYNWQHEEDSKKQHIGFVIGKDYKYSKEITSIDDKDEEVGADIYSMVSVCFKAIQEQQKQIEELTNELKKLKESE